MKDQLLSPDFNSNQYERPNQNWICGWAKEGKPCRIGPDAKGNCRATFECKPALELREGETKGRYKCTRPKEFGGPCEHGPMPDGTCSRAIPRCQPQRSLRGKRGIFTWCIIALTVAGLLIAFYSPARLKFISPGKISSNHAVTKCVDCHRAADQGPAHWSKAAFTANPAPLEFSALASLDGKGMTQIDNSCQRCHTHHNFHQPNVVWDLSCSACHQEHQGSVHMRAPSSENCIACHGDSDTMRASAEKGQKLSPAVFNFHAEHGKTVFKASRPERGYTQVFQSFAEGHPEFQVHAQNLKDPNTLRFNHRLHLGDTVHAKGGGKLGCADCHKPDASGAHFQKISFEANCRECHSLQFDKHNPGLQLPHGNPEAIRAFLRSLEIQYADLARKTGVADKGVVETFVQEQMQNLRQEFRTGEDLERQVFFSGEKKSTEGRALYPGCAYCHEVKPRGELVPAVTPPQIPEGWLARGRFDHSKHLQMNCATCHEASTSHSTADILLPSKASCVTCHSAKGGVRNDCATCHEFHSHP